MDLAVQQKVTKSYDWVLSMSVGEYIPKNLEQVYLSNIAQPAREGVVLSWGYMKLGRPACPNEKHQKEVILLMKAHGFVLDFEWSTTLRMMSILPWHRRSILVFKRVKGPNMAS